MRVEIKEDKSTSKKYVAIFYDGDKKVKTTRFGADGFLDRTIGATTEQMKAYRARHRGDNLRDKYSAGSLSYYVLWSSKSLSQGIRTYKNRFNLS